MIKDQYTTGDRGIPGYEHYITDENNDGIDDRIDDPVVLSEQAKRSYNRRVRDTGFWYRAGEFLKGNTKGGRILHAVVTAAVGLFTGVNIEPLQEVITGTASQTTITGTMEFDLLNIILTALLVVIPVVIRSLAKGLITEVLTEVSEVAQRVKTAREESSPGGKEITEEERNSILKEAEDILTLLWRRLLRSRLTSFLGLNRLLDEKSKDVGP